ncbi:hypothetical protein B5M10_11300 [Pluralibacter gergoviae]|uniref:FidL n=1 Tax=Pluralibacter gergoviae TaxID=61647 RepID=A0A0F0W039_PLUGE|nr:hypothetical protein SS31_02850 [Pluralibacter gergoviae]KMK14666.1 hypothetical protein ABW06_07455 [Pluralibacter gergoviae]KMK26540.1 hypothetical protein ABW10_03595 [Pluralibacter gergoviae]OUR01154.1 hypothetical protein B5M10_11300 [Pluralibacter gergoviae]
MNITVKKIVLALLAVNILLAGWTLWSIRQHYQRPTLDFLCESTLAMHRHSEADSRVFTFEGTVLVRFRADETGYIWLIGSASEADNKTTVAREISFRYRSKDEKGIYALTTTSQHRAQRDDTPDALIERNISGKPGTTDSYVVRRVNANTYSIGGMYSPVIMCVDRA